MALKVGDIQLSKQHPSVRILIITKLLPAVASKQSCNCIEMLSMEEKKAFVYSSPKRRCCFISSIILIFLVLFGIVVRKINTRLLNVERAFINLEEILQANPLQRHVVLVHSPTIYYNWYGGVVDAIYRARKGLVTKEEVMKQISIVAYGINSAAQILKLSPIE
ncbi:hypothetical protein pdam_00006431 [Pocillopora damicornis]|uniref:Transferrin receptor-like dimerisation domain-containing protein n=1 Tax=Pocillopora damicornis TaxID=46731 RepID=A0A3M6UY35_POCDA|nr:hypothetical protein pdam_00006431 [Pocillopora damicornis]